MWTDALITLAAAFVACIIALFAYDAIKKAQIEKKTA